MRKISTICYQICLKILLIETNLLIFLKAKEKMLPYTCLLGWYVAVSNIKVFRDLQSSPAGLSERRHIVLHIEISLKFDLRFLYGRSQRAFSFLCFPGVIRLIMDADKENEV